MSSRFRSCTVALLAAVALVAFAPPSSAAPGDLDPSFGAGGVVRLDVTKNSDFAWDVALQADGKIVAVGMSNNQGLVVRLLPDGSPDPSFGTGGIVLSDVPGKDVFLAVALEPDGSIVAVGTANDTGPNNRILVARYSADGSPDPSFAGVGWTTYPRTPSSGLGVAVQGNGQILVLATHLAPMVLRFNTDGTLDRHFGHGGVAPLGVNAYRPTLALQSTGRILVAGETVFGGHADWRVEALTRRGDSDPTFATGGVAQGFWSGPVQLPGMVVGKDDRIVLAGAGKQFNALRLTSDGTLDPTFGGDGETRFPRPPGYLDTYDMALQGTRPLIVGQSVNQTFLMRLTSRGQLDTGFGSGGTVITSIGHYFVVKGLAVQHDGAIVGAGIAEADSAKLNHEVGAARFLGK